MQTYEFALVLTEEAGKDEASAKKLATELLDKVKGKVKESKVLGMRQLAYPIKKANRGWYGIFMVELEVESIAELDKLIKLEEKILRYLLTRAE
jgi:small subunit ribosomal protein S6